MKWPKDGNGHCPNAVHPEKGTSKGDDNEEHRADEWQDDVTNGADETLADDTHEKNDLYKKANQKEDDEKLE